MIKYFFGAYWKGCELEGRVNYKWVANAIKFMWILLFFLTDRSEWDKAYKFAIRWSINLCNLIQFI